MYGKVNVRTCLQWKKKMVNFRGTCDLPLFLSQTTASVNKKGEGEMYRGRFSGGVLFFCPNSLGQTYAEP